MRTRRNTVRNTAGGAGVGPKRALWAGEGFECAVDVDIMSSLYLPRRKQTQNKGRTRGGGHHRQCWEWVKHTSGLRIYLRICVIARQTLETGSGNLPSDPPAFGHISEDWDNSAPVCAHAWTEKSFLILGMTYGGRVFSIVLTGCCWCCHFH